ncbi:MAG: hypothetical protein ACAI34_19705 [Verrucomicrobium sp.]
MKIRLALFFTGLALSCYGQSSKEEAPASQGASSGSAKTAEAKGKPATPKVKALSEKELNALLARRLEGGMEYKFAQFANMFFVSSRIQTGCSVVLSSRAKDILEAELQPPFPAFYKPTLREFLDAVAWQTFSTWRYDTSGDQINNETGDTTPMEDIAVFDFVRADRTKPYEVILAKDWKSEDRGHWLALIPSKFPVGMDIYEMGTYSAKDPEKEPELMKKVREEMSMEWSRRIGKEAKADDLVAAKAGPYDALYFEALIPSQLEKEIRWRQWVFTVGNQCFFIVSTILPEMEETLFPDVKQMLGSFKMKTPQPVK